MFYSTNKSIFLKKHKLKALVTKDFHTFAGVIKLTKNYGRLSATVQQY